MPVDAATVAAEDTLFEPSRMEQVQDENGNWLWQSVERHVAHWATCPDADAFRRRVQERRLFRD
jgi:hypothetical protein